MSQLSGRGGLIDGMPDRRTFRILTGSGGGRPGAFDLLAVLQDAKQQLRLSEIGRLGDLHIATAQRILNVLLARGYAARTGDTYAATFESAQL